MIIKSGIVSLIILALIALGTPSMAQEIQAEEGQLNSLYPEGKPYSPYADRNFPEQPLWGDSHLHT